MVLPLGIDGIPARIPSMGRSGLERKAIRSQRHYGMIKPRYDASDHVGKRNRNINKATETYLEAARSMPMMTCQGRDKLEPGYLALAAVSPVLVPTTYGLPRSEERRTSRSCVEVNGHKLRRDDLSCRSDGGMSML